jgi:hypothetical protein
MNTDFIYWTFSSASQCVSSFVGLLLTGYALVLSQIESVGSRDDSLDEIHHALRAVYHQRLTLLAWLTALSVGLSLSVVWFTRTNVPPPEWLMLLAACMDGFAIISGLGFVVAIIDPRKFQKLAARELEEQQAEEPGKQLAPAAEFFKVFRKLERALRDQLKARPETRDGEDANVIASAGLKRLAEMLLKVDGISEELNAELIKLNRYRNLIFHGHAEQADLKMIERTRAALGNIRHLA